MPLANNLIHTTVQRLGTDRRLTHLFLFHQLKTCMIDSAVCYTKPPQNWYRLLTQRRRWGSNAFFNSTRNFWSIRIHPLTRISALFDLIKMSLVVFRFFNIGLFICQIIVGIEVKSLLIQLPFVGYPPLYFFLFSILKKRLRRILHKIFIGFIINTFFSGFVSVGIMSTVFYNIGNVSWGPVDSLPQQKIQPSNIYTVPLNQLPDKKLPVTIVAVS